MLRLAVLLTLALLAIGLAQTPALADDRATCEKATGEVALAACARAIATGDSAGSSSQSSTTTGVSSSSVRRPRCAIKDYDVAIKLNPDDLFAFNNRANAWRDKGNLDRAIADCSEAIRLDPDYAAAYVNRGLVHERKQAARPARACDFTAALARRRRNTTTAGEPRGWRASGWRCWRGFRRTRRGPAVREDPAGVPAR